MAFLALWTRRFGEFWVGRQDIQKSRIAAEIGIAFAVLDKERFTQSTMADRSLQLEILDLFERQLLDLQQQLKTTIISTEGRKFYSHTLRGSASAIGALEIENLAKTWEKVGFDQIVFGGLLAQAKDAFLAETRSFRS